MRMQNARNNATDRGYNQSDSNERAATVACQDSHSADRQTSVFLMTLCLILPWCECAWSSYCCEHVSLGAKLCRFSLISLVLLPNIFYRDVHLCLLNSHHLESTAIGSSVFPQLNHNLLLIDIKGGSCCSSYV